MESIFGIKDNEFYRQPGLTLSINEKNQLEGFAEYIITNDSSSNILNKLVPGKFASEIDDYLPSWAGDLKIESWDISSDEGSIATVKVRFIAGQYNQFEGTETKNRPTYRLEGRLGEKSLTEHPKFNDLDDDQQVALKELISGNIIWAQDVFTPGEYKLYYPRHEDGSQTVFYVTLDGDSINFANLIAGGITTYVSPTITWTETSEGKSQTQAEQLNKLGKTATPRGNPPEVESPRDWMLTGASQEQRGSEEGAIYQTTLEWTLSDEKGWNEFLYKM
jgi:hypothetical protein